MRKMTWLLVACATVVVVLAVIVSPIRNRDQRDAQYFRDLHAWLVANQKTLDDYAEDVIAGRVRKQPGSILHEPPNLPHGAFFTTGTTVDSNTNVYLVLKGSPVTFNVGLVKRRGESALLGYGSESR